MKNDESDNVIITIDIKLNFEKNECYDIGTRKRLWIRKCPRCNKTLFHGRKDVRDFATKNNRICCSCVGFTRPRIFGRKNSEIAKKKMSESRKGKYCGSKSHMFGKHNPHTEETKRKIRLSTIKRISNNRCNGYQIKPSFNISACRFIDEYGKQNGYNFRHAMNGGEYHIKELGYFLDGYDKEKNIIIEYDEPRHFDIQGNLKPKDVQRMNEIKEHLPGCKFLRYNEKMNELKEF